MIDKITKFIYASITYLFVYLFLVIPTRVLKVKVPKNIWLIGELRDSARDNGLAFYEYCAKNHLGNIYYVIDKKSPDYNFIKYKNHVIQYGSIKHIYYYLLASRVIVCFEGGLCLSKTLENILRKTGIFRANEVFLQHGITKDYILNYTFENYKPDLFITATKPETEFIIEKFNQPKRAVKMTGFARFDLLKNTATGAGSILVAPTWRRWMVSLTPEDFAKTTFFKKYTELFNKLSNLGDINTTVYLHNNFQKYTHLFPTYKNIHFVTSNNARINALFMKSDLMITDYSSVAFDFAYMNKPVVYYQFDADEFFSKHYQRGYFSYKRDGFGPVARTPSECLTEIDRIKRRNFSMSEKYSNRAKNIFAYSDNKNCERIYHKVVELDKGAVHA